VRHRQPKGAATARLTLPSGTSALLYPITSPITKFTEIAKARGDSILEAHRRVRRAVRTTGVTQRIDHKPPVDVLGVYVYLPTDGGR